MFSRQVKFLPLFLLLFLLTVRTAEACSCGPRPTVLDSFNYSDVVVVVTAISVEKATPEQTAAPGLMPRGRDVDGVKSTSMRVDQVFKGPLKVGDEMIFSQGGGATCVWTFSETVIGRKFLFYLTRYKDSPRWIAGTCGRSNFVEHAADDLLYLTNLNKVRNKTRVSGTLRFYYETGESLAGRSIRIVGAKRTVELKTDNNGVYEVYDLPPGRYFVEPEIPKGWKVGRFFLDYSPSLDRSTKEGSSQRIPIVLEANKHAGLDIMFKIDNAVRGHIYDPMGQPMNDVCLKLVPADGTKGPYLADCTENGGAFEIDEIPPGDYLLVVNDDGKKTSTEPFGTFYYPNAVKREEAAVFNINIGERVEDLEIYPTIEMKTITVEGVLLYSDGKPVVDEWVSFTSAKQQSGEKDEQNETNVKTDEKGRFSIKIVQGAEGSLYGGMFAYIGQYENCPKLDRLIKQGDDSVPEIKSLPTEIRATSNLYGVEVKFSFPYCKKAKDE